MQSFNGGISLDFPKRKDLKIKRITPHLITLPISCSYPEVKEGDSVRLGQLIAVGAKNVYATVSGVVEVVNDKQIEIRNDFANRTVITETVENADSLSSEYLLELLRKYSIAGMGGAGYPTYKKYSTDKKIETIVLNGCECEPYLTCDYQLMKERSELIILGAKLFQKIVNANRIVLCIEEHSKDIAKNFSSLEVMVFPDRYPQGSEKMISLSGFNREIPYNSFPEEIGMIVSNVATCATFALSVITGLPPVSRIVTVEGNVKEPSNIDAPFGTSVGALLDFCGGMNESCTVISGGPMTGKRIEDLSFPITYTTNGVIALNSRDNMVSPCIRCGGCVRVCPSKLTPFRIEEEFLSGRYEVCAALHAEQCISCGCCSFVCPAKRELAHNVTQAKQRRYSL